MLSLTAFFKNQQVIGQQLKEWPVLSASMPGTGARAFCHTCIVNGVLIRYFSDSNEELDTIIHSPDLGLGLSHLLLCDRINKRFPRLKPAHLGIANSELCLFLSPPGERDRYQVHLLMHHTPEEVGDKIKISLRNGKRPFLMFHRGSICDDYYDTSSLHYPSLHWSNTEEAAQQIEEFAAGKVKRFDIRANVRKTPFRPIFLKSLCANCNTAYLIPVALTLLFNRVVPSLKPLVFYVGMCRRSYVAEYLSIFDKELIFEAKRCGLPMAKLSGVYKSDGFYCRNSACPSCNKNARQPISPPSGVNLKLCPAPISPLTVDSRFLFNDIIEWSADELVPEDVVSDETWRKQFACLLNAETFAFKE